MVCSNCGYVLGPDDQYCGGCGAFLTDAPEGEAGHDQPVVAVPGDPDPADPLRDTAPQDTPWGIPYAPSGQPSPTRSGPSAGMIAAAVAAVALVALLLFWVLRPEAEETGVSDSDTTGATATASATGDAAGTATDTPTMSSTPTPTESPTTAPEQTEIELPGSAEPCNNVGAFVVYRGNTTTSCPFAENVGRAFAEVEQPVTADVALSGVSSPVTGLDYDLTCEFTTPVRCTGGNNAVVYLVPAS